MRVPSLTFVAAVAVILGQDALAQTMNGMPGMPVPSVAEQIGTLPPALKLPSTRWPRSFDDLRQTKPESWSWHERNTARGSTEALVQDPVRKRGVGRIVLGAVVGAVGGLFAGGYVGAAIEGDSCHCDDPGLMGSLIGAPIGAVVGGIVGGKWLF